MKSKGIKNLLIDLGGVLINLDRQRCIENFQKLGLRNVEDLLDIHNPNGLLMQLHRASEFSHIRQQIKDAAIENL